MNRAWQQIIGSIVATIIFSLVALTPVWISETIEGVETARSDIVRSETVETSNFTLPFWEFNNNTKTQVNEFTEGYVYYSSITGDVGPSMAAYNISGYWDVTSIDQTLTSSFILLEIWAGIDPNTLIMNDMLQVSIGINCPLNYSIHSIQIVGLNPDYSKGSTWGTVLPSGFSDIQKNTHYYNGTWTQFDLGEGAAEVGSYPLTAMSFRIKIEEDYPASTPIYTNLQIVPEYYRVVEYDNLTIYEAYVLKASNPYTWIQWGLGFSGFFFLLTAALINPIINPRKVLSRINVNLPGRRRS